MDYATCKPDIFLKMGIARIFFFAYKHEHLWNKVSRNQKTQRRPVLSLALQCSLFIFASLKFDMVLPLEKQEVSSTRRREGCVMLL